MVHWFVIAKTRVVPFLDLPVHLLIILPTYVLLLADLLGYDAILFLSGAIVNRPVYGDLAFHVMQGWIVTLLRNYIYIFLR